MKVCLYSHAFPPSIGGIEAVSELLADYLHAQGVEVTVVTQTAATGEKSATAYRVVRRPDRAALLRLAGSHDLVHCNGMSVRGAFAAFRCGVPLIVTHQAYNAAVPRSLSELRKMVVNEGLRRPPHAAASAWGMRLADINACISRFILNRLRPPRALVLHNPVGRIFQPLPDAQQTRDFLFVGRLVADKGCDVLLRALAECSERGHRYQVEICGDGPERKRLQALAQECGLAERVHFLGSLHGEDLVRAYNRSLAVVVPSVWQEPLGIVALEAMACRRAVIASAGGGLGEVVQGVGITFPNGDCKSLADCLIHLAENASLRQEIERRGAKFAKSCAIDAIGKAYLNLYESLLREKTKRRHPQSYAWAFRLLARAMPGEAVFGDNHILVLARAGELVESHRSNEARKALKP